MKKISVLIIDDHAILRMGLSSLINAEKDLEVIGEAEDGAIGASLAEKLDPDVIILDLMMPEMDGVETTRRIISENPSAHILILTSFGTCDALGHALSTGALGAILKNAAFPDLVQAIHTVAAGKQFIPADIKRLLSANPPLPALSPRQREILEAITRGLSNTEIAKMLDIGPDVVKLHITAIFEKLGAANRAEAVAIALKKHLLKI